MNCATPDGMEQRTAYFDEHYERDLHEQDIAEMLADESRDDPATWGPTC